MRFKVEIGTQAEASAKLQELHTEYLDFRFNKVLSHIESPIQKRFLRRKIAQMKTVLREYELGIRKA